MLSKTRRNSRSLPRVIAWICYIYFDAWCITCCCWGISARFTGGCVRFHTSLYFKYSSCSCLCHIYSWFLPMSWILDLSIFLSVVCIYICLADYAELPVLLYLLQCWVYHMLSKTRRSSRNLHTVIGEVLVLGLLVVYKYCTVPYCTVRTAICI